MRVLVCALVTIAAGASCGDNIHPTVLVSTQVASTTLTAGDEVGAKCSIVDNLGNPVLDKQGNPIADGTTFAISYEAPDSFSTDAAGAVIAAKAGTATVRCAAPSLGLVDDMPPPQITIVAGPPARVITELATPTTLAGAADAVTCVTFDAFDNPVADPPHSLAVSPSGAGTTTTAADVTVTLVGQYTVSCVVMGATDVTSADLVVLPALPASLAGALDPERTLYAILDQVTVIATAFDQFGNRVDDVGYAYAAAPTTPSPGTAKFQFMADGEYTLSADVTSPTQNNVALALALPPAVDAHGPAIQCMRIDTPSVASEAYMIQQAPATVVVPVNISAAFAVASVTIGGAPAAFDPSSGNYRAGVPIGFGMNFIDVVATDTKGVQNSTTCFVLAASSYTAETAQLEGTLGLRLDQNAVGDSNPAGLNSLDDIFHTVMGSSQLKTLVNQGLLNANPINSGSCGFFACNPNVTDTRGTITWGTPSTSLTLIAGGLQASVTLPNVTLQVSACGTTCCIGGSNITVTADTITATVNFSLALQGGLLRAKVQGTPNVTIGNVNLNGSGFCGFVVNLVQSFFTGTVKTAVQNALTSFINSEVGPLLDNVVSSIDINTLATSFAVPRLDNTGNITLNFGLDFSSLDISATTSTPGRVLLGIGTRFTPGTTAESLPSLGIAQRDPSALLDPPGTSPSSPVGISAYEGLLNEVLHALWRGGYFQATVTVAGGSAVIDGRLPPVAAIQGSNTAQLMLGGISATLTIPGIIDTPIQILFGGRARRR